jgi:hypothetical protein
VSCRDSLLGVSLTGLQDVSHYLALCAYPVPFLARGMPTDSPSARTLLYVAASVLFTLSAIEAAVASALPYLNGRRSLCWLSVRMGSTFFFPRPL